MRFQPLVGKSCKSVLQRLFFSQANDLKLRCTFCHTFQHERCYGYIAGNGATPPDTHACYTCLLEPKEKPLLTGMKRMTVYRRAIYMLYNDGFPNSLTELAKNLGIVFRYARNLA